MCRVCTSSGRYAECEVKSASILTTESLRMKVQEKVRFTFNFVYVAEEIFLFASVDCGAKCCVQVCTCLTAFMLGVGKVLSAFEGSGDVW